MTTAKVYSRASKHLTNGDVDLDTNTIKVALIASTYTPAQNTHETFADVTADEVPATGGYTARGQALTSPAYTQSTTTEQVDFDNPVWGPPATITFRYAVVYKDTGTDGTSYLIGYVDYVTDQSVVAGTLTLTLNAAGLINLVAV